MRVSMSIEAPKQSEAPQSSEAIQNKELREYFSSEETSSEFEYGVNSVVDRALSILRERFAAAENEEGFAYHNVEHTKNVMHRVADILRVIHEHNTEEAGERDIGLGMIAASEHDVYQLYEEDVEDEEHRFRKRFSGDNEAVSAYDAVVQMERVNEEAGAQVFTTEDMERVSEAINVTVPGFNPEAKTVVQPSLSEESGVVARALALADLGAAGIDGADQALKEGDALFREENIDIDEALHGDESLSDERKEGMRSRMLSWSRNQVSFIQGRKDMFEQELEGLPDESRRALKEQVFTHFDEAIEAAREKAQQREGMAFEELARDMGYTVSS